MSSPSLSRADRRLAVLTALLAVACALQWLAATGAAAAQLDIVAVLGPAADRQVSLVADIRPGATTPIPSDSFSVTAGGVRLPARAMPVISDQLAIGLVVDASAAGAKALQAGVSGAANFLLQMPVAARTAVVADTRPPAVVAPLHGGAADALLALSSVRARNERSTSDALTLVLRQLPATPDGSRVVVLYTSAPDAGGEAATDLAARLTTAHALLAVVTAGTDRRYWSQVTAATGGVLVAAQPRATMAAFDDVADIMRGRYLLTFPMTGQLPARVSVRVGTADGTLTAVALVPPPSSPASDQPNDGRAGVLWVLALGVAAA